MNNTADRISDADADRCVKCGLCLPHCPTWNLTGHETDSPRGRISIMQALAKGAFRPDAASAAYLERCTGCLNCERVCPADVPYGRLIDYGRAALVANQRPPSALERAAATILASPILRAIAIAAGRGWRTVRLSNIARRSERFGRTRAGQLERWLNPRPRKPLKRRYEPRGRPAGRVQLFTGCLGPALDADTLHATVKTLTALGYGVDVPKQQRCCGAVWLHAGYPERAARLALKNIDAFARSDREIVVPASGCAAMLREYARVVPGVAAGRFAARVVDPVAFAVDRGLAERKLGAVRLNAVLHHPCTFRNVVRTDRITDQALGLVPELVVIPADPKSGCCGGAGAYAIAQPALANELDARTVSSLRGHSADVTLTSNIGCALSIGRYRGPDTLRVRHPVSIIAEALSNARPV